MDPEVKKYFRKILNSFFIGLLWLFVIVTSGLYFQLGLVNGKLQWYNFIFYGFFVVSFLFLIRFYYWLWKEDFHVSE
jgi:hypothetical protein